MSDLIDRHAAIDALSDGAMVNYQAAGHNNGLVKAIDVIKGLPSATETKTSSILEFDSVVYDEDVDMWFINCSCTACSQKIVKIIKKLKATIEFEYSFCPLCGAKIAKKGEA